MILDLVAEKASPMLKDQLLTWFTAVCKMLQIDSVAIDD